jgi:hypothetical protein
MFKKHLLHRLGHRLQRQHPLGHPASRPAARQGALRMARLSAASCLLRRAPPAPQERRRRDLSPELRLALPVPPRHLHPPPGLAAHPAPGRHHHRPWPQRPGPPQPRPASQHRPVGPIRWPIAAERATTARAAPATGNHQARPRASACPGESGASGAGGRGRSSGLRCRRKRPVLRQHRRNFRPEPHGHGSFAAEFLDELSAGADDAVAPLDAGFAGGTPGGACWSAQKDVSASWSRYMAACQGAAMLAPGA